jgi:AcrR family transcriptional regulator/DNA-binding MarR family transcriptional regulator
VRGGRVASVGREQVSEVQRARMITAMAEVAGERGAANATVAHVVARSGVSRRTFYEMFADREDCLAAAFAEAASRAQRRVLAAYNGEQAWRERLRAGTAALLLYLEEEPAMGRLLIVEALGGGPRVLAHRSQLVRLLVEEIDRGRALARSAPLPLTAEGVLGGAFALVHARLSQRDPQPLSGLLGSLMGLIVGPYLGAAAARRELDRPAPKLARATRRERSDPLRGLDMRLTYRTMRVLLAVGSQPGASNKTVAQAAGVGDQGQISKLLRRLESLGLVQNSGEGHTKGERNIWTLTPRGTEVQQAIQTQTG